MKFNIGVDISFFRYSFVLGTAAFVSVYIYFIIARPSAKLDLKEWEKKAPTAIRIATVGFVTTFISLIGILWDRVGILSPVVGFILLNGMISLTTVFDAAKAATPVQESKKH